jgi:hypothetical protein
MNSIHELDTVNSHYDKRQREKETEMEIEDNMSRHAQTIEIVAIIAFLYRGSSLAVPPWAVYQ